MSLGEPAKRFAHHGGELRVYTHASAATRTPMTFAVFLPARALGAAAAVPRGSVPVIYYLSGLTCTWENFSTKAGAFAHAAAAGVAIVAPDTSPRGAGVATGEPAHWSLGVGAGFYVDATQPGWREHYQMATYVAHELPALLAAGLPALAAPASGGASIMGHSMGGLGALSLALRSPGRYLRVSAFAPIAHPSAAPWGRAAYEAFLGDEGSGVAVPAAPAAPAAAAAWAAYDPTELVSRYAGPPLRISIEQGGADEFLAAGQLLPRDFLAAAARAKEAGAAVEVEYAERESYDHSYYFVSTFIGRHIAEHAAALEAALAAAAAAEAGGGGGGRKE
jgi:S-formylglutathione hydrolase